MVLLTVTIGCGRGKLSGYPVIESGDASTASDAADATQLPDAATATASALCGPTPRRLVDQADLPAPPAGASVGLWPIRATSAGIYYSVWFASQAPSGAYVGGSLWRVPLAGGPPQQVASGTLFGRPVVTGQELLVDEGGIGDAMRIALFPLSGGAPRTIFTLSSQAGAPLSLTTDGTSVFIADNVGIQAVPLNSAYGDAAVTLAYGTGWPSVVGAVAQRLIWFIPRVQWKASLCLFEPIASRSPVVLVRRDRDTSLAGERAGTGAPG
jgi:hypothetical protein